MSTSLTPAIATAIADAIRRGIPLETTLETLDIPQPTFATWIKDAERDVRPSTGHVVSPSQKALAVNLVTQIRRARAEHEAELVSRIANHVGKDERHDWRASAFLLTHGPSRTRWYEHRQTTVDQRIEVHHAHTQVRELSDDALEQFLGDAGSQPALGSGETTEA